MGFNLSIRHKVEMGVLRGKESAAIATFRKIHRNDECGPLEVQIDGGFCAEEWDATEDGYESTFYPDDYVRDPGPTPNWIEKTKTGLRIPLD